MGVWWGGWVVTQQRKLNSASKVQLQPAHAGPASAHRSVLARSNHSTPFPHLGNSPSLSLPSPALQTRSMTELYQHAQKYNSQLQEYNGKMQGELQAANESVARLQARGGGGGGPACGAPLAVQ